VIVVPADLQKALAKDTDSAAAFNTLFYTHQKEYVNWIEDARKDQTRVNRIHKAIEMLKAGKKGI